MSLTSLNLAPLSRHLDIFLGDCCAATKKGDDDSRSLCADCKCKYDLKMMISRQNIFPNETCAFQYTGALGDGFCNDELNNENCAYDGGDCCLPEMKSNVCEDCSCKVKAFLEL